MVVWSALILFWIFAVALLLATYRRPLLAYWREPVLRCPVVILESDDWGAGPTEQAAALRHLREILSAIKDEAEHPAVMTLGVVLGVVDTVLMKADQNAGYHRRDLTCSDYAEILAELRAGFDSDVFAPQLHGLEHYWPAALLRVARNDSRVRDWLSADEQRTEALPDALQSRWIDGAQLPSRALVAEEVEVAVSEEAVLFEKLFCQLPRVAVPNTFVWTADVEQAWAAVGVRFVVTPGVRYGSRDQEGRLVGDHTGLLNGQQSAEGITYVVRDVYFEPTRGHTPQQAVAEICARTAMGRPALVETHRFNYLGAQAEANFAALQALLDLVLLQLPHLRFMSTQTLGEALLAPDTDMVERQFAERWVVWVRRAQSLPRFGKLARWTGLALLLWLAATVIRGFALGWRAA